MNDLKYAAKLALEAMQLIKEADSHYATPKQVCDARALYEPTIKALEEALAKQEQGDFVSGKIFDQIVALNESNAARVLELEEKLAKQEQGDFVSGKIFDQIVALNESNAARVLELEEKLAKQEQGEPVALPCIIVGVDYSMDTAAMLIQDTREYEFNNGQYWLTTEKAQQRTWVGLTDEEMKKTWYEMQNIMGWYSFQEISKAIEAKLRSKNA